MLWQGRSVRSKTGGRYSPSRAKRRFEIGGAAADTTIGDNREKIARTLGGNSKVQVLRAIFANVANPKTGEIKKVRIETVAENNADPNFMRRNILTKGAVIRTEIGRARIRSRPGQHGVVNAILIE
jgi:small subunit ribosomal protein S8e